MSVYTRGEVTGRCEPFLLFENHRVYVDVFLLFLCFLRCLSGLIRRAATMVSLLFGKASWENKEQVVGLLRKKKEVFRGER